MTFHALLTRANNKKKCIRNGLLGLPSLSPIHCAVEFIKAPPCYRLIQRVAFSMFFVILIFFSTLGSYLKWLSKLLSEERLQQEKRKNCTFEYVASSFNVIGTTHCASCRAYS